MESNGSKLNKETFAYKPIIYDELQVYIHFRIIIHINISRLKNIIIVKKLYKVFILNIAVLRDVYNKVPTCGEIKQRELFRVLHLNTPKKKRITRNWFLYEIKMDFFFPMEKNLYWMCCLKSSCKS